MEQTAYEIGMVGLGVMGRNLLLNMADHGYAVAGYDKDLSKVQALKTEAEHRQIAGAQSMEELVSLLRKPRVVMMLVPAGPAVDAVIEAVLPHLEPGDTIIDGGNSHFIDTDRRFKSLAETKINFLGIGISGGESGARYGPSMMPGGPKEAYERVRPIFEAAAAKVNGEPCVAYLGPGSAGHYVKMVHNGIEYGLMQLIAESYDLMKRGLGMEPGDLHQVYRRWNQGELNSYLIEITANIFARLDEDSHKYLVDLIKGEAHQKGTGMWASQDAMNLGVPVPTIDLAVAMRNLSGLSKERQSASQILSGPQPAFEGDHQEFIEKLRNALFTGMIITYAQGMSQLVAASAQYAYDLNLETVARIWRGGCIIRAALLEDFRQAYQNHPDLPNLLLDERIGQMVSSRGPALRSVAVTAANLGLPAPGMMASLGYFDGLRSEWLPANLIQAQRDYFGAHTYQRIDRAGVFHTHWEEGLVKPQ